MHSGRHTFGSGAMMQMDSEHRRRASPGYAAIAREVDNQSPYRRTLPETNAGDTELQRQLNELKQMVSTLVRDNWQSNERRRLNEAARLFESSSFRQTGKNISRLGGIGNQTLRQKVTSDPGVGDADIASQIDELRRVVSALSGGQDASAGRPRPNTTPQTFGASSSNQAQKYRSSLASKANTPIDESSSAPNHSDDSPSLSRNPSVASIGSASNKRGRKTPGGYPCVSCDAKFDLPSQLRQHERNHMSYEERPHPCSQCDQRFIFPKDLTRHERRAHNMHKAGGEGQLSMSSEYHSPKDQPSASDEHCHGQTLANNSQASKDRTGRRRQHLDNPAAARVRQRRSSSVLQSRLLSEQAILSSPQTNTRATSPGSRRDSGVPDFFAGDTDGLQGDLLPPDADADPEQLVQLFRSLQIQKTAQGKMISELQHAIIESKTRAETMRNERDALAAIYYQRLDARAELQTAKSPEHQIQSPMQPERSQEPRDDVDFDEFIIYTGHKSPRQLDEATGHRDA